MKYEREWWCSNCCGSGPDKPCAVCGAVNLTPTMVPQITSAETTNRNDLNQALVEHCAKAAQKDFGAYGMAGMQPDILWQAVAATVIHEAVLFLKAGNPLNELLNKRQSSG